MELSYDLISEFAKVVTGKQKTSTESTVYGTVIVDSNGNKYVKLDGSDQITPLSDDERPAMDSTSVNANDGERVSVLIKNHTATVTGNISSPAARTGDVENLEDQVSEIQKFDILIGKQIQAQEGYIKKLQTDKADVGELTAAVAKIEELETTSVTTEKLKAERAEIDDILADKIDAEVVDAKYATIESLNTTNANISNLNTDYVTFKEATGSKITASEGRIDNLETEMFDAETGEIKFARIDFANIDQAWMDEFYAKSGLIENVVAGDATVTGYLVGVTIKGELIEGGTIVADKLVIKGDDGLYYKLNTDGVTTEAEQTEYNSLNGSVITAKSITAEKVNVKDLVAFGATIGGFHIKDDALYSGVKESIDNTTLGVYLDREGQMSVGDSNNYIKYYKSSEEGYKLNIAVDNIQINGKTGVSDLLDCIRIDPNEPSIVIGAGKNSMSLSLRNDTISFEKDGTQFGWWDGVNFHTGNVVIDVTERAQFGNFAMVPRSDGSLSFLKVTDNTGFYAYVGSGVMTFYGSYPVLDVTTLVINDVPGELDGTTLILGGQ